MAVNVRAIVLLLAAGLFPSLAWADEPPETPYRCEDSVVTQVGNYFEGDPRSGFYGVFRTRLGVEQFSEEQARVVVRHFDPVMAQQKVGDKVQVCLVNFPQSGSGCNPDKDPRGRFYRVYNYRLKAAYTEPNANHLCGGA